jgi:hypothetical protein
MVSKPTRESVIHGADLINLPLTETEIEPIAERLGVLLDGSEQIAHLVDDTAELDIRFSASWEAYPV